MYVKNFHNLFAPAHIQIRIKVYGSGMKILISFWNSLEDNSNIITTKNLFMGSTLYTQASEGSQLWETQVQKLFNKIMNLLEIVYLKMSTCLVKNSENTERQKRKQNCPSWKVHQGSSWVACHYVPLNLHPDYPGIYPTYRNVPKFGLFSPLPFIAEPYPLCGSITICLFIVFTDIWIIFCFSLWRIRLLWTLLNKPFWGHAFSCLVCQYPGEKGRIIGPAYVWTYK